MDTLVLKLVVTPVLIGSASLAGRRWGAGMGGWLVGLPFTSGPIVLFLALDHGAGFAADTALGSLAGAGAEAAFGLVYGAACLRRGWPAALGASALAFAAAGALLQHAALPLALLAPAVVAALGTALALMPRRARGPAVTSAPRWDLPARMVVATAIVLLLTESATVLGARLSGILATFPVYAGILTVFAHRLEGPASALAVLRGLLFGLFAFAGFFVVVAALIARAGVGPAFAAATATALVLQGASLWALRRPAGRPARSPR